MTRQQLAERLRLAWIEVQTAAVAYAHGAGSAAEVVNRRNRYDALRAHAARTAADLLAS